MKVSPADIKDQLIKNFEKSNLSQGGSRSGQ